MQAGEHAVQVVQACGHTGQTALEAAELLDLIKGGHEYLVERHQRFGPGAPHHNIKDEALGIVQHVGERIGLGVTLPLNGLGGGDEPTQGGFFLYNLDVRAGVGSGGHESHSLQKIGRTAHAVQRAAPGKLVAHGHEIDGIAGDVQGAHGFENFLVLGGVEILRHEGLKGEGGRAGILEHRAQHRAFGVDAAGGQCGCDLFGHAGFHAVPSLRMNDGDTRAAQNRQ